MKPTTEVYDNLIKAPKRLNLLRGGARSGKSHSLLQMAAKWLWTGKIGEHIFEWTDDDGKIHKSDKGIALIARQTFPALRRTLLREFVAILRHQGTLKFIKYRKSYHEFIYKGRQISFLPLDEEEKVLGMQTVWFWINEGNNVPIGIFDNLLLRCECMCFLDYNPFDPYGWINQEIELKRLPQRKDVNLNISTYHMNPHIPPRMKQEIEDTKYRDPDLYAVMAKGNWATPKGVIFPEIDIIDTMPNDFNYTEHFGLDFGYTDPDVLVRVLIKDWHLYIEELFYKSSNSTEDLYNMIDILEINKTIYADSQDARTIKDLKNKGIYLRKAKKGGDSVVAGIQKIKSYRIHILKTSTNVIKDFRKYKWEVDKETGKVVIGSNGMPKPENKNKHSADAVAYSLSKVSDFKSRLIEMNV